MQCIDPGFLNMIRPCMIRPSWFDHDHVILSNSICTWWKMEDSSCCEVVGTDTSETLSEVSSIISGRQAQLYVKTKEGKAKGVPTNCFLPEEESFSAWKGAIRRSVAEVESIAVSDVILDKIYVVNKSSRSLSLTGLVGDDGVLAASLEYPLRQKNGKKSTAIIKLACDWHRKGK